MSLELKGVGIDLVSLSRIRKFLNRHPSKISRRLLTKSERKKISSKRLSPVVLARLLAAKEAFFKAVGRSWMGLEGFGAIEIKGFAHGRFQVESKFPDGRFRKAEGAFFGTQKFVGAQVTLWSED